MERAQEILKALESTMKKYHVNKTKVPAADLEGKYRISFQKLKGRLKAEAEAYLEAYCLSGFLALKSDSGELVAAIERSIRENQIPKRAGRAVFKDFSLQELQEIAREQRERNQGLYRTYFNRHICLYAAGPSWDQDDPQTPLIYNDIVDKFYDEAAGGWISREKPTWAAILIFIKSENKTIEQKEGTA